jgi:ATP-dependent Clp protease adapter protein ClpS
MLKVLMEIFSWSESLATSVMLEAHNNGFAVTGEYSKEVALDYCTKLLEKGLYAETRKSDEMGDLNSQS